MKEKSILFVSNLVAICDSRWCLHRALELLMVFLLVFQFHWMPDSLRYIASKCVLPTAKVCYSINNCPFFTCFANFHSIQFQYITFSKPTTQSDCNSNVNSTTDRWQLSTCVRWHAVKCVRFTSVSCMNWLIDKTFGKTNTHPHLSIRHLIEK